MVELSRKPNYSAYLALAAISALYLYRFVSISRGLPDEGEFLTGAQRVLDGDIPSRDFVELMGPGSFYWLAAFFKVFGTSLVTARTLLLGTGVATVLLVFYLARQIGSMGIFAAAFVLTMLIPQMPMNSSHHDSNLLALLSFAIFLTGLQRRSSPIIFLAGLLAGAASCFLQTKGACAAAGFLSILLWQFRGRWRYQLSGAVLAGFVCAIAAEFTFYAFAGALGDLIRNNFLWPMMHYNSANAAPYGFQLWMIWWPQWFSALSQALPVTLSLAGVTIMSVPYLLVMALPCLPLLGFWWRATAFRAELVPYWVMGYALLASELHRRDLGHLINGSPILIIVLFSLLERSMTKVVTLSTLALMICVAINGAISFAAAGAMHTVLKTRRGKALTSKNDDALAYLVEQTRSGEEVFVYPYAPRYYFFADVRNPTKYAELAYSPNTDDQFRDAVNDLEKKKVRLVLWDSVLAGNNLRGVFPSYQQPPLGKLIMEPYLESHYRQTGIKNGFRILERLP